MATPYTWVEFLDDRRGPSEPSVAHMAKRIRINGQDVLAAEDPTVEFGPHDVTRVTVTLLPNSVTFTRFYDDAKPSPGLVRAWRWLRDRLPVHH